MERLDNCIPELGTSNLVENNIVSGHRSTIIGHSFVNHLQVQYPVARSDNESPDMTNDKGDSTPTSHSPQRQGLLEKRSSVNGKL